MIDSVFFKDAAMSTYIRTFILVISILIIPSDSQALELTDNAREEMKSGKSLKGKKSLFSTLFLLNLMSSKKQIRSSASTLSVPEGTGKSISPLSFLQSPENQKHAVADLYEQYGYNSAVKLSLHSFSKHKYSFQDRLIRSGTYIKTMADIFSEEGLPRELVFLPLIESRFDPYAYSSTRASGPWQFMPATARRLNLRIDWWIDERRDPVKSTRAAAAYLRYLHKRFKSWNLVLAAYNAGEGRIGSALRNSETNDYWTLRETKYLASETKNYVPSYIAATAIAMNPEKFGLSNIKYNAPLSYDEVIIESPMDLELAARFAGTKTPKIRDLNPELRRLCTPPNVSQYTLRIPKGSKRKFLRNLEKTKGYEAYYINLYTVKRGDTIAKIADKIDSTIQSINDMNALGRRALIMTGKKLLVPVEENWDRLLKHRSYR